MTSIQVGTSDFKAFSRSLQKSMPWLRTDMLRQMKVAGRMVADHARELVAPYSSKIGSTIKVQVRAGSVAIVLPRNRDIVGLLEFGGPGGGGGGGAWKHPTFGHDPEVSQQSHPYFYKALDDKKDDAMMLIVEAVEEALAMAGRL